MKKFKNASKNKGKHVIKLLIVALFGATTISSCLFENKQKANVDKLEYTHLAEKKTPNIPVSYTNSKEFEINKSVHIDTFMINVNKIKKNKIYLTYIVKGKIKLNGNRGYIVEKVLINDNYDNDSIRTIKINPQIKYIGKRNQGQDYQYFLFKNKLKLTTSKTDKPYIKITCGENNIFSIRLNKE